MPASRAAIGTRILAIRTLQLANGFFGTLISLRVAREDFGATLDGLVLSACFVGYTIAGRVAELGLEPARRRLDARQAVHCQHELGKAIPRLDRGLGRGPFP